MIAGHDAQEPAGNQWQTDALRRSRSDGPHRARLQARLRRARALGREAAPRPSNLRERWRLHGDRPRGTLPASVRVSGRSQPLRRHRGSTHASSRPGSRLRTQLRHVCSRIVCRRRELRRLLRCCDLPLRVRAHALTDLTGRTGTWHRAPTASALDLLVTSNAVAKATRSQSARAWVSTGLVSLHAPLATYGCTAQPAVADASAEHRLVRAIRALHPHETQRAGFNHVARPV